MKDYVLNLVKEEPNPVRARNKIREYLQVRILHAIQKAGGMIPLAFHGGTALRLLFGLFRYSEDLDFTLERPESGYDFLRLIRAVQSEFKGEGYGISMKINDRKAVHSAFIRFSGFLHELGLSPHSDENLSVKIEIDTQPPAGASLSTTIVRRHLILNLQHHDRPSLVAGKLNALLTREYTKGRDVYDLFWYLSDRSWPEPNLEMLNHALKQSGWKKPPMAAETWRTVLSDHVKSLNWDQVISDVRPFLEIEEEVDLLTLDNLLKLLIHSNRD